MKKNIIITMAALVIFLFFPLYSGASQKYKSRKDWSDLHKDEHRLFGSEKEKKLKVDAYVLEIEEWEKHYSMSLCWFYKYTSYPKFYSRSVNLIPFLPIGYKLKSKIDNRKKFYIFPLYYTRTDGPEKFTVNPLYYSYIREGGYDKSWLYLLWSGREYGYSQKNYKALFPIFYKSQSSMIEGKKGETLYETRNFSLLHYYSSKSIGDSGNSENIERTWWAPIIPLTYHNTDKKGGHRNVLGILDYSWTEFENKSRMDWFWLAPLVFWEGGENGYTVIMPPIYMKNKFSNGELNQMLFPIFVKYRNINRNFSFDEGGFKKNYTEHSYSILHGSYKKYKGRDKWNGTPETSAFWFPLLPAFYCSEQPGKEKHFNIAGIFDWKTEPEKGLKKFWISPIFYYNRDSYLHVLPPIFISFKDRSKQTYLSPVLIHSRSRGASSWLIGPIYISSKEYGSGKTRYEKKSRYFFPVAFLNQQEDFFSKEKEFFSPLLYYKKTEKKLTEERDRAEERFWLPSLPIIFSYHTACEGTEKSLLTLAHWKRDRSGSMEKLALYPFLSWDYGMGGSKIIFPFYIKPRGWTEKEGIAMGIPILPYYHRWSTGEEVKHLLPFYLSWEYRDWKARLVLPYSFTYEDSKRKHKIYIWGKVISYAAGPNPLPEIALSKGKENNLWHLDSDVLLAYGLIKFSDRITFRNPFKEKAEAKENHFAFSGEGKTNPAYNNTPGKPGKIKLVKAKTISRKNSESFSGIRLFYGLAAYEKADGNHHFRVLPLWWISWGENLEGKRTWALNYFHYRSSVQSFRLFLPLYLSMKDREEDTEYKIAGPLFLPLYYRQRIGGSYKKGYLFTLFWKEYDKEEDLKEYTVLWPLINWYNSPEKSGARFAPFFWRKKFQEGGVRTDRTFIALPAYSIKRTSLENGKILSDFDISIFRYYRYEDSADKTAEKYFYPLLPFYCYSNNITNNTGSFFPESNRKGTETRNSIIAHRTRYLIPIFYWNSHSEKSISGNGKQEERSLYALPLLYWNSKAVEKPDEQTPGKTNRFDEDTFFLMGFFKYNSPALKEKSLLFGLINYKDYFRDSQYRLSLLWGLAGAWDLGNNRGWKISPILHRLRSEQEKSFSVLYGLYDDVYYNKTKDKEFKLLYGLFFYKSLIHSRALNDFSYGGKGLFVPVKEHRTWVLPIVYAKNVESYDSLQYRTRNNISLLHYWKSEYHTGKNKSREYSQFRFPFLPVFYREKEVISNENGVDMNFTSASPLWFWNTREFKDWDERIENRSRWFPIVPLMYYNSKTHLSENSSDIKLINPLFFWNRKQVKNNEPAGYTRLWAPVIPLCYYSGNSKRTHINSLGAFDYLRDDVKNIKRTWVLPPLYYSSDDAYSSLRLSLLYWRYKNYLTGETARLFLPAYLSWHRPEGNTKVILGTYWHSSDEYFRSNIYYILDYKNYLNDKTKSMDLLFGAAGFQWSPGIFRARAFYGALLNYENYRNTPDYDFSMGLSLIKWARRKDSVSRTVMPLFHYKKDDYSRTLLSPALLSYRSEDTAGSLSLVGLGSLYFSLHERYGGENLELYLLGIPYYTREKAEKGFRSRGVLWGALYKKEEEKETGFEKTSILYFVYRKIKMEGEVYHRIFGVKI